jgi:hypothetical protein
MVSCHRWRYFYTQYKQDHDVFLFLRTWIQHPCDFLRELLNHYQIELVHLNPNSILQIVVFVHLCEAFLGIPPNFPLFKNYFFLKYQPSAANRKVIGGVGLQTRPRASFLDLPMKTSLWGWHRTWFHCKNHKPSLPPFIGSDIKALYSSLKTTLDQIDVSASTTHLIAPSWHGLDSFLTQAPVKHSQDKYQFLNVAIKRMAET